jgi:hypothetical protein
MTRIWVTCLQRQFLCSLGKLVALGKEEGMALVQRMVWGGKHDFLGNNMKNLEPGAKRVPSPGFYTQGQQSSPCGHTAPVVVASGPVHQKRALRSHVWGPMEGALDSARLHLISNPLHWLCDLRPATCPTTQCVPVSPFNLPCPLSVLMWRWGMAGGSCLWDSLTLIGDFNASEPQRGNVSL